MRPTRRLAVAAGLLASATFAGAGVREYAVEASASILDSPPRIEFQWVSDPAAAEYFAYEKSVNDTAWGDPVTVRLITPFLDRMLRQLWSPIGF